MTHTSRSQVAQADCGSCYSKPCQATLPLQRSLKHFVYPDPYSLTAAAAAPPLRPSGLPSFSSLSKSSQTLSRRLPGQTPAPLDPRREKRGFLRPSFRLRLVDRHQAPFTLSHDMV